ncbi:hypothetical protein AB6A23_12945 [Paenibacillus tarimensis]
MRTQVRLNLYERGIVDALVANFGYTADAARRLVVEYIRVIRKLGGYDTCLDHAERLVHAQNAGHSPEAWLERIRIIDLEAAQDKGIPHLERNEYAHVR